MSGPEFLMAVRKELLGRQISFFCKREAARLMDMPRGSTVLDVAFRVGLGTHLAQAEVWEGGGGRREEERPIKWWWCVFIFF